MEISRDLCGSITMIVVGQDRDFAIKSLSNFLRRIRLCVDVHTVSSLFNGNEGAPRRSINRPSYAISSSFFFLRSSRGKTHR